MKVLHVNDVASVGSILVRASQGRDELFQPTLRRNLADWMGVGGLALHRVADAWRLRSRFLRGAFTHLHVHYATFAHLAELTGNPYSVHVHGGDVLLDLEHPAKRWLVLRALRQARHVVVSTPDLVAPTRMLRGDARYVPNPMELPAVPASPSISGGPRVVLLSKMDRLKGWPEQVTLVESLKQAIPEVAFSFFTHGQLSSEERQGLTSRLRAIGGIATPALSRDQFLKHVASHHVALGQLEVGSLGMSEMEAMALGLPTIASVGAHIVAGQRPPVLDPGQAVAEVRALWESGTGALERRGEEGRTYLREHHDPQQSLRLLEAALEGTS